MQYKHLKDFSEQTTQKLFWIITYGHAIGLVAGLLSAYYLGKLLPWLPGWIFYPLGLLAGVALTWSQQGQPGYQVVLRWGQFQLRRLLASTTLDVDSRQYYRRPSTATRPFTLSGMVSYSGENSDAESGPTRLHPGGAATPPSTQRRALHHASGPVASRKDA